MMRIEYAKFYRKNGLRKVGQLLNPPTFWYSELQLPKNSSVHFPQYGEDDFEIPQDHFLAKGIKRYMFCEIADHYSASDALGSFRLAAGNVSSMTRDYYRLNKRMRRYNPEKPVHDQLTLVFHTYGLINRRYVYTAKMRDTKLNRWKNHWDTVITGLNREAEANQRHQFIVIDVPADIPPLTRLRKNEELDVNTIRYFKNPDHWLIQSIWNFFTDPTEVGGGVPYIFRNLSEKAIGNVNIIWKSGNVCTVTNLGILRSFNSAFEDNGKYDSLRFNKYILNMFMTLRETTDVRDAEQQEDSHNDTSMVEPGDVDDIPDDIVNLDDEITIADDDSTDYGSDELDALFAGFDDDDDISDEVWLTRERQRDVQNNLTTDNVTDTKKNKLVKVTVVSSDGTDEEEAEVSADELVDARLKALEDMQETVGEEDDASELSSTDMAYKEYNPTLITTVDYDKLVIDAATKQAGSGILTAGELRLATKRADTYKTLKDPRDPKKLFIDNLTVTDEDIRLDGDTQIANDVVKALVPDETMHQSSLKQFDSKYIKEVMPKHIAMTVMEVAKAGVTVQDYDIERVKNINDDFEIHSVRLTTVAGKQSTLRFRLPVVDENGEFKAGGVKSRMRKQWADLPIRKISASEVALTSYYSKLFVRRTSRAAFNYEKWLMDYIISTGIDGSNTSITELKLNDVFDNYARLPREYTLISRRVSSFIAKGYTFHFDISRSLDNFPHRIRSQMVVPVAVSVDNPSDVIYMDKQTGLLKIDEEYISLESFLGIDLSKAPEDYAELSFLGKPIPIVFILGYWVGLGNLLKTLGAVYTRVKQVSADMKDGYLAVRFKDETLLFDKKDQRSCLIVNGLNRFRNEIRKHSVYAFDEREVYSTVFDNVGLNVRYLKECQTMFPMWVDHITRDVLIEMKEPTELTLLFIRAVELLHNDQHPDSMDTAYMRIKGYERFSGLLYSEMVKEIRNFNNRNNRKDKALSMNPEQVWYAILKDETVIVVEESNPIHNLKEQEIVVYRGTGGRSGRSMVANARKYHKNGMGVVSEATVDSKDVGAVTYLTPDANLGSLYGTIKTIDPSIEQPPGKLISTSSLLSPGADIDD